MDRRIVLSVGGAACLIARLRRLRARYVEVTSERIPRREDTTT